MCLVEWKTVHNVIMSILNSNAKLYGAKQLKIVGNVERAAVILNEKLCNSKTIYHSNAQTHTHT